ncbi:unnamed protein product [Prorocentrum cordatum]|uniref:Tyr recombinase domain-containing protein n=1 Tax=Prorocentrum cordatum TaxID=2364126 RepID=A0ABN9XLD8_9DINO|nr:unnamed protein product [Polarella glacialis]
MLQKLSEGTRAGYEGGWRLWVAVRQAQGLSPWLPGRDREERLADEEALVNFAVLLARVVGRTEGTIKQKLFAVRYAHLVAGYSDPLLHRGTPIRKAEVQHFLTVAGLAVGLSREEIGSHSLRIGGATAMYHVTEDLSRVRRFGRWQSGAFHGYLWESHEPMKGISGKMARDTSSLTNPAKDNAPSRAAAGTESARRGAGRSGGRGADGGAKYRPVPSASDDIVGPQPEVGLRRQSRHLREPKERLADEEALINFAVLLARVVGRAEGTIKQKLFAVRYAHLVAGYSDPLLHRGRLWSTLAGLKRWQGPETKRKKPVTPDGRSWSFERVLHGEDVEPKKEGKRVASFQDADEMVIYIKGSKTDQLNVGTVKNHYRAGTTLCPIAAMERLQAHHPQRIRGTEERLPLFRWASGTPIRRAEVQHFLTVAGLAAGLSREEIGSHSLRIGGATAMYHVTEDLSRVRRFGRWQSDAFHGYLWESHEPMKGISGKMARDTSSLTNPAKDNAPSRVAAGTESARRGAGRSGGRGADGGAKYRPVPSASDDIFGPQPEVGLRRQSRHRREPKA